MSVGSAEKVRNTLLAVAVFGSALLSACGAQVNAGGITPRPDRSTPPATAPANEESAVTGAFNNETGNLDVSKTSSDTVVLEDTIATVEDVNGDEEVVPQPTLGEPTSPKPVDPVNLEEEPLNGVGGEQKPVDEGQADTGIVVDVQTGEVGDDDYSNGTGEVPEGDEVDENIYMVELNNGINVQIDMNDTGLAVADTEKLEAILEHITQGENRKVNINVSIQPGTDMGLYGEQAMVALATRASELGMGTFDNEYVDLVAQVVILQKLINTDGAVYYNVIIWDEADAQKRCDALTYALLAMALNQMYPDRWEGVHHLQFMDAFQDRKRYQFFTDNQLLEVASQLYKLKNGVPDYTQQAIFN